ncbi:MAG: ribonuclease HII [Bacillota bacterium]|jgi:ribonuclease HII
MAKTGADYYKLPWEARLKEERACWRRGFTRVAGLDEAGRGPLAGPVVAAVFVITPDFDLQELNDSKQLTPIQRETAYRYLTSGDWEYGVGVVTAAEIDRINIYQASRQAMWRALQTLAQPPDYLLVDALTVPVTTIPQTGLIHGDALSVAIAAASVLAKYTRDQLMVEYDRIYPGYGFARHKGYPTMQHYEALRQLGPCDLHRKSFRLQKETAAASLDLFE